MVLKGRKQRKSIVLDVEPDLPDGTEVQVIVPATWEAERQALLSVGCHPDFGDEIEKAQQEWIPKPF